MNLVEWLHPAVIPLACVERRAGLLQWTIPWWAVPPKGLTAALDLPDRSACLLHMIYLRRASLRLVSLFAPSTSTNRGNVYQRIWPGASIGP